MWSMPQTSAPSIPGQQQQQQQQQRLLAQMVENNAQAFSQVSGLDSLRQRVREYTFSREATRKRLRQSSHPQITHSQQLAAPSFNPAAYGMPMPGQRPPLLAPSGWSSGAEEEERRPTAGSSSYATAASSYEPLQAREGAAKGAWRAAGRALVPPTPLLHPIPPAPRVRWDTEADEPSRTLAGERSLHSAGRIARHDQHTAGTLNHVDHHKI